MTLLLVEPDQNLGINKIHIARPIFLLVPALLNIIFSSHKNLPAYKKSAPCGPIWPPFGPIWPRLANVAHTCTFFASCVRVRARILTKIYVWVFYYYISLSFKFHTDPSFGCGDIFLTQCTLRYQFVMVSICTVQDGSCSHNVKILYVCICLCT